MTKKSVQIENFDHLKTLIEGYKSFKKTIKSNDIQISFEVDYRCRSQSYQLGLNVIYEMYKEITKHENVVLDPLETSEVEQEPISLFTVM